MAGFRLDHKLLRELENAELAKYLRSMQEKLVEDEITAEISTAVQYESVPPDAYCLWVCVSKTPGPIASAIGQTFSALVRRHGLKMFGKKLKTWDWRSVWDALGQAEGLLSLCGQLSVVDVKFLCLVLGFCNNVTKIRDREKSIEQLFCGLLPSLFPNSELQTHDRRPLDCYYMKIIPACSAEFVDSLLDRAAHLNKSELPLDRLILSLPDLFRQYAIKSLLESQVIRFDVWDYLPPLLGCYPPKKGEYGFSASMTFSAEIIERIVDNNDASFPPSSFLPNLVWPFLTRVGKRKVDYHRLETIIKKVFTYAKAHAECRNALASGRSLLQTTLTNVWSRHSDLFEKHLITSLKLSYDSRDLRAYSQLACKAQFSKRYDLLRLYCLHVPKLHADIEDNAQLVLLPKGLWEFRHFSSLPDKKGLLLLNRLVRLCPEGDFLARAHYQALYDYPAHGRDHPDPQLLLSYFQHSLEGSATEERGSESVNKHKAMSMRCRDQEERVYHAKAAIFHAIATASLKIYHDTVVWTQRFIRDPLTMKTLFAESTVKPSSRLLAMPFPLSNQVTASAVRDHVCAANKILLTFLEMACLALREPSFRPGDCRAPLSLFSWVVDDRLKCLNLPSESSSLIGEDLYHMIWKDTAETLLAAETIGQQPGHEGLGFHHKGGPLGFTGNIRKTQHISHLSFYTFLDELAERRDQLWQQLRPKRNPEVTALRPPWPRGLAIQDLVLGYDIANKAAFGLTPFLATRAASVTLIPLDQAKEPIPQDASVRKAIGSFVDSFELSLRIHVMQQPSEASMSTIVSQLWSHASRLTSDRMNAAEALRFWRKIFIEAASVVAYELPCPDAIPEHPLIPEDCDIRGSTEWNPDINRPIAELVRQLDPIILDCLLTVSIRSYASYNEFDVPRPATIVYDIPRSWHLKSSKRAQEGVIASTALYLDSKRSKDSGMRLLSSSFPSSHDVRYPPLFLDADYLMRDDLSETFAMDSLSTEVTRAPPLLLSQLTTSLLNELSQMQPDNTRISSLERTAYGALRILLASDRPVLASRLVVRTILDRPDASSWHRQLLTKSFLRRLGPSQAKAAFVEFATGIQEKLEMVTQHKQDVREDSRKAKPFVKVTTVKFLAQMLEDANFITVANAIDVLIRILETASHIDIRVAVIDAILAMIHRNEKDSKGLMDRVFGAFEALIPVMSGLDERHQMDEKAWLEAEKSATVPFVPENTISDTPLLETFVRTASDQSLPKAMRRDIIRRILLPTLKGSINNNTRWFRIFSSLCGYTQLSLPPVPVKVSMLPRLLNGSAFAFLPASVLSLYQGYIQYLIDPTQEFLSMLDHIKSDAVLRTSNAGRYFLSIFDEQPSGLYSIARLITTGFPVIEVEDGSTISQVQAYVVKQCSSALRLRDPSFHLWQHMIQQLEPPFPFTSSEPLNIGGVWQQNARPVLETAINEVESFRSSLTWQNDPKRFPAFLPRTFHLTLWRLPYAALRSGKTSGALYEEYATLIASQLSQLVARGLPGHLNDLDDISAAAMRLQGWDQRVHVGCRLGDTDSKYVSPAEHLGIQIAVKILAGVTRENIGKEERAKMQDMCQKWKESSDEGVRLKGWSIESRLTND